MPFGNKTPGGPFESRLTVDGNPKFSVALPSCKLLLQKKRTHRFVLCTRMNSSLFSSHFQPGNRWRLSVLVSVHAACRAHPSSLPHHLSGAGEAPRSKFPSSCRELSSASHITSYCAARLGGRLAFDPSFDSPALPPHLPQSQSLTPFPACPQSASMPS
ncbi:hypothetical protein M440DRAFT_125512 [Trichoderma longibrachiatum ATCC 18648]|uniref:Uncharacterized protein n=1 Tax=Trichoderma longibrachiatum ATCC 18648 TaxID=983965 RepID=A0A2T4BXE5_TRILO|nr:hypothetical protein M440DRAFT_125512 [Trichoderma longibrachiatum ATCC 18648]